MVPNVVEMVFCCLNLYLLFVPLLIDMENQVRSEDMYKAIECIKEFMEGAYQDAQIVEKIVSFLDIDVLQKAPQPNGVKALLRNLTPT